MAEAARRTPPLIEDNTITEIIAGQVTVMPRPSPPHAVTAMNLGSDVHGPFQRGRGGPGGWWIVSEPEIAFGEDRLVPDLAGWQRACLPELPETSYFPPSNWCCEVLSPGTEARDRGEKMPIYAAFQVGHVWLVDPLLKTLEVFRLEGSRYSLLGVFIGPVKVRAEPFDAIEIDLSAVWP